MWGHATEKHCNRRLSLTGEAAKRLIQNEMFSNLADTMNKRSQYCGALPTAIGDHVLNTIHDSQPLEMDERINYVLGSTQTVD